MSTPRACPSCRRPVVGKAVAVLRDLGECADCWRKSMHEAEQLSRIPHLCQDCGAPHEPDDAEFCSMVQAENRAQVLP